jgi:hypothetical protein
VEVNLATLRIPRGSSPSLPSKLWQGEANSSPPLNLTGVPLAVIGSDLPNNPVVTITDAPNGEFKLDFPDTSSWPMARSFKFRLRVGVPGAPGTFATPDVEVIAF